MEHIYYTKAADYEGNTLYHLPEGEICTVDLSSGGHTNNKRVNSIIRSFSKCTSFKFDNAFFNIPVYAKNHLGKPRKKL